MKSPEEILSFWFDEVGQKNWFSNSTEIKNLINKKFLSTWRNALEGSFSLWLTYPSGSLAYIILTDQFSRNMFKGSADAFLMDNAALSVAKNCVYKGWDLKIDEPYRQFFYLPFMHSECVSDQERFIRLLLTRMPETGSESLSEAKNYREIIRKFGRFPYRNEALDRAHTTSEMEFLVTSGHMKAMKSLSIKV